MLIHGAVIKEQGLTFAVVSVQASQMVNQAVAQKTVATLKPVFPGIPIVLMTQDPDGKACFMGRSDIATFLSTVPVKSIPWKRYEVLFSA